ncbi:carboxymuconolactone decarboxylase family protein [Chloroflexota bacterium]
MTRMKDAKTAEEMVDSWRDELLPGGNIDGSKQRFKVYIDEKPEIIEDIAHRPMVKILERDILDPKTRELVVIGMLAMVKSPGIILHVQAALQAGCTKEEVMEVIYLSGYQSGKCNVAAVGEFLTEGFKQAEKLSAKAAII